MELAMRLLQELASQRTQESTARRFVSGAALAERHHVTRAAVWKAIGQLRRLGTPVEAVPHRGYRLTLPCSPLNSADVQALLLPATAARLRSGVCAGSINSTNTQLLARGAPPIGQFDFLTAEYQSAGRGRRGRSWLAPPGGAICLSWSWSFDALPSQIGALSLAVGVAALRALARCDVRGVGLKWPNDLMIPAGMTTAAQQTQPPRKLGGILIEMRAEAGGPTHVVAGLGLNLALDPALQREVGELGHLPAELSQLRQPPPERNTLVAALLNEQVAAMQVFGEKGLLPFLPEFTAADVLTGRAVHLQGANAALTSGIARGVAPDGALRVEHGGQIHRIIAGEVSVRSVAS
ncbi:MAG: biotin--[acetyl-CoA-carboxylase] ligase [Nevskiaceae bacterium]|jgi:BirA family biotin operon repressor/biotin-[acetyl-CoA-carboxylase] ligase|nr:biotin--[acetyl-CoA-carboxylase] ligase [Nevskiaceae bacterium]